MKYKNGVEVREGDIVLIAHGRGAEQGVVRKVLLPGTQDALDWSAPDGGVLIEGGGLGLSVSASLEDDEDVVFVRRGA